MTNGHVVTGFRCCRCFAHLHAGFLREDLADCEHMRELVLHANDLVGGEFEWCLLYVLGDELESPLSSACLSHFLGGRAPPGTEYRPQFLPLTRSGPLLVE